VARQEFCINHPDRPAETRCRQCHKPICPECIKSDAGGQFCSFQCSEAYKDFQAREKPKDKRGMGLISKLVLLVVIAAVVVLVGAKVLHIGACKSILKLIGM